MTVYTVTSTDDLWSEPLDRCVAGSYTSRGRAIEECARYVFERFGLRDDFAYSMANDENHPEAKEFFSRRRDGKYVVARGCIAKLMEFIKDELGGQGCYYVYDGRNSWHFDVDENDVVGELWHTVTWGDSDCEDPEFTTPYPETFTSEETAVQTFLDYVKDLFRGHHMKWSDEFVRTVKASLKDDGKVQVDLNDGCCVSCVLYHDDAKNIKE